MATQGPFTPFSSQSAPPKGHLIRIRDEQGRLVAASPPKPLPRCASQVLGRGAQADARGAAQVLGRGAQVDARGAAQVLDRGAQAAARGAARCAAAPRR